MRISNRLLFAAAFVLFIGVVSVMAQKKFPAVVMNPTLWEKVDVQAPDECEGTPQKCAAQMLKAVNIDAGSSPKYKVYRLGERDERNLTIVFVTQTVKEDDSVSGIRYRLAISLGDVEDRTFKLETLGKQYRCARGRKGWGKSLCS